MVIYLHGHVYISLTLFEYLGVVSLQSCLEIFWFNSGTKNIWRAIYLEICCTVDWFFEFIKVYCLFSVAMKFIDKYFRFFII